MAREVRGDSQSLPDAHPLIFLDGRDLAMNVKPLRTLQTASGLSGDAVDGRYPMRLAWGQGTVVRRTRCNARVKDSLGRTRNYDWMHVQAARV